MFRVLPIAILLALLTHGWPLVAAAAESVESDAGLAFFEKRIRPVLVEHCYECHSGESESVKGGLRVDTRAGLLRGGDSGPAIQPGDSSEGTLIGALRHETFEMPPSKKLPESIVDDIVRWIDAGATDPREGEAGPTPSAAVDVAASRNFWSFQPLSDPALPAVRHEDWPRAEIDRFLLARMEAAGVIPAHDAEPRQLLRRIYFDLIGLPPTPAEIEAFLTNPAPNAFELTVDRLLASPQFGERWGRHWLDIARFAESTGGGRTRILRNAWRYRDYVVSAWNEDKPYDQFVREQLAGDLLPWSTRQQRATQLTATGYLALGPINYELQDKTLLEMEIVDEQLDSLGKTFLGMTIGCARCHDHKFDPIPTRDYYALAGILRSTKTVEHANVSNYIERPVPLPPEEQAKLDAHEAAVASLEQQLANIEARQTELTGGVLDYRHVETLAGTVLDDTHAELTGDWAASTSVKPFVGDAYRYTDGDAGGSHTARFVTQLDAERYQVRLAYTAHSNRASNTRVTVEHLGGTAEFRVNQQQPPPDDPVFFALGEFEFSPQQPAVVTVSNRNADGKVIIDAVQFLPRSSTATRTVDREALDALAQVGAEKRQVAAELTKLKRQAPSPAPQVLSVEEGDEIGDCPLHVRGNVRQLGEVVPRGFLSVASWSSEPSIGDSESGRRELAAWIADPHHPLTARVFANRLWYHLMGTGLVRTVDNFGASGEPPSHPALLDFLAGELIRNDWSTKSLIRQIVLSRAYGMSTESPDRTAERDPENRLLSHQSRRRLDAEAIRDALLAVSGKLDYQMYGPSLSPRVRSEFGYEFHGRRRSVYVPVFRNTLHELFEVFDFANPNLVHGRRATSTLPTQALYLMNSPFVMQCARDAANHHLSAPEPTIEAAFTKALGRPPTDAEQQQVEAYLADFDDDEAGQLEGWTRVYQALFSCLDFRYLE